MNCREAQDNFAEYWDLSGDDAIRRQLDEHLLQCEACAEEFRIWEESESLIRELTDESVQIGPIDHVSRGVMDRIYAEQSWLMPAHHRTYRFSSSFRITAAAVIAACLAVFMCGFLYLAFGSAGGDSSAAMVRMTGLLDTANAGSDVTTVSADFYENVPVASISDPVVLQVVPTIPEYWIALSLLGVIGALLILNWLSRTKV